VASSTRSRITNGYQQVDTRHQDDPSGQEHLEPIISKGISAGHSRQHLSRHRLDSPKAKNARNFTQCDSLLIGDKCGAHTVPYIEARTRTATFEHEATTSKISDDSCSTASSAAESRGRSRISLIVNGFVQVTCCSSCRWRFHAPKRRS
jgi:Fe-S cluster assembly protein SufB